MMTRKLRIAFICGPQTRHMIHWAESLENMGHEIHYISLKEPSTCVSNKFIIQPKMKNNYAKFIVNSSNLSKLLKHINPDIVHTYYLTNYALLTTLARFPRTVVTVAGSDLFVEPQKSKIFKVINRYVCQKAALVHSVAQHMTDELVSQGVLSEKIITFPEGVEKSIFKFKTQIQERHPIIISTRNHYPIYDLETLVKAIPKVVKNIPKASFIIAGKGEQSDYLQKLANKLDVSKHINFCGYLKWEEMAELLNTAKLYISTALSDGTSVSLLQAMACGAVPIVTDIIANREWISPLKNGQVFNPGDSEALAIQILNSLNNEHFLKSASEGNLTQIKQKGYDSQILDELIGHYLRLLR